jgi:hypothetical protein
VLVLVLHRGAVTVSSTGAENQIQGDDNGHVGRPGEVSLAPPYPEPFASYGGSHIRLTSRRRHIRVCVFITAGPITKLFAGGGGGEWTTCAMIDDEPRPVWMSPLITH